MNRQRPASDDPSREIARLRGAGPLPEAKRAQASEVARLSMERDSRRALLASAPEDARRALEREYQQTNFAPAHWRVFDNGHRDIPEQRQGGHTK
jgi:hypothetical protein